MSRESFLERVRHAAQAGQAYRVHVEPFPEETSYVGYQGDICEAFAEELTAVGGKCHIVSHAAAALDTVEQLVAEYQARHALTWQHPVLDSLGLFGRLEQLQVRISDLDQLSALAEADQRTTSLAADIGFTSADFAIAETGSLAVCAKPGQERIASLLPPVHVAIVTQDQIVPDLIDMFQMLDRTDLPSNLALITGPSKTGDIELQLTTGVHGPGDVHVIVIRDN